MKNHSELGVAYNEAYPEALRDVEKGLVDKRRAQAASNHSVDVPPFPGVGVALSGGGIRSATFCLGVFRALARADLVRRIDFLSTVSGGGYFGAFLGGLFTPREPDGGKANAQQRPASLIEQVKKDLLGLHSQPVEWLRENGRYMSPNGAGDTLLMIAVALRNLVAIQVVITAALLSVFAGATLLMNGYGSALKRVVQAVLPVSETLFSWSPWSSVPTLILALAVVPLGSAFWFTQRGWPWPKQKGMTPFATLAALLLIVGLTGRYTSGWGRVAFAEAILAVAWWGLAWIFAARECAGEGARMARQERLERNKLSRWLSAALWATVALTLFSFVDGVGNALALTQPRWMFAALAAAWPSIVAALGVLQTLAPVVTTLGKQKRLAFPTQLAAGMAAVALVAVMIVSVSALVHYAASARYSDDVLRWLFIAAVALAAAFAWTITFLNLSSHNSLYGARITRAYIGASNPSRQNGTATISETVPGDAIPMSAYRPYETGGPLHLINVTLNETVSGRSQIEQRDRKGLGMAIGPAGVSVGRRHHALWTTDSPRKLTGTPPLDKDAGDFQIFPQGEGQVFAAEELDLGDWTSISGAAFTTGLGSRTSLALSVLFGLLNVRLGYWWNSGVSPSIRRIRRNPTGQAERAETPGGRFYRLVAATVPVYGYLFNELLARFHGPARRRWYLSDGGHSENTGAYELIRRRVPFIVICDDGCDPEFAFEDLGNLVRRVRTDFSAEVAFYSQEQLAELLPSDLLPHFGLPADFETRESRRQHRCCHALLAGVFYDDDDRRKTEPDSVLVILKPRVSGDEPLDVLEYKRTHPAFPHEPTIDQYFDEAQWESYRRLGEHIASVVFETTGAGVWAPGRFVKPPATKAAWRRIRPSATVGASPAAGSS